MRFLRGPEELGKGILITDESGYGSFNDIVDNHNTITWWDGWDNVELIFSPYKEELINIIKNNEFPYNELKSKYEHVFDFNSIARSRNLIWQLNDNGNKYVYKNYKSSAINIARPSRL